LIYQKYCAQKINKEHCAQKNLAKKGIETKKLSQNREDPRYVVVRNMSRNPYDTVGISLIPLVAETQNENLKQDVMFFEY